MGPVDESILRLWYDQQVPRELQVLGMGVKHPA